MNSDKEGNGVELVSGALPEEMCEVRSSIAPETGNRIEGAKRTEEVYGIQGKFYQRGWVTGFFGRNGKGHFSIPACLPPGTNLHGKVVELTIRVLEEA